MTNMWRSEWVRYVLPCISLLAMVVLWEVFVRHSGIQEWVLPAPTSVGSTAFDWRVELWTHSWVTLYETVLGFLAAVVIALPIAILVVYAPLLRHTVYPILLALQSVPKVAIAPLITLWVGFGTLPKVVIVFLVCFFPIVVNATAGLEATPKAMLNLMRSMQANPWQVFKRVRLPVALPTIMVGCKVAITLAVIGAVIGEFVGSEEGLGYLILTSSAQSQTPLAFAALAILTVMSIVLYYAIELLEKWLVRWQ
ncbi:Putative ABC transporter permease protein [Alloalcanivorax dieselolei B5]|uniref:Putative ABC transporter permease protein n=1 Tax=Alcanivorax dieselolei (strain DSM 16502 / CGMCC 1.3690 / MCCC 1A00001 / B-5) TaxID=930169 RepID=K0CF41_ALCDB|nr:ABC transporter permease [Alloalcanivorax dieselolei]AFT72189.1 Putative ABC transporter permease protein [Alloalcanivorax dieselolei B5]GGJ75958.1 ABC transporter permease [Alloalcanivorax dieselolei]